MRMAVGKDNHDLRLLDDPNKTLNYEGFYKSAKVFILCASYFLYEMSWTTVVRRPVIILYAIDFIFIYPPPHIFSFLPFLLFQFEYLNYFALSSVPDLSVALAATCLHWVYHLLLLKLPAKRPLLHEQWPHGLCFSSILVASSVLLLFLIASYYHLSITIKLQ